MKYVEEERVIMTETVSLKSAPKVTVEMTSLTAGGP